MQFHDPGRTKLANWRSCWLDSHIALPPFQLEPHLTDPSLVTITICHGERGVWMSKDIPLSSLIQIFHFWSEDPEGTFMKLFGLDTWPHGGQVSKRTTDLRVPVSIEELI